TRLRANELGEESSKPSYQRGSPRKLATIALTKANLNVPAAAAVTNVRPAQPAPMREPREEEVAAAPPVAPVHAQAKGIGLWDRILGFFGSGEPTLPAQPRPRQQESRGRNDRDGRGDRDRNQRRDGSRDGGRG